MKKLISIFLSIALIMTCGFGVMAATDLESANCIETLTALDILIGDEDGNLNLDKNITRAEFATIITRVLGVQSTDTKEIFIDVPESHWANSAIHTCCNLDIVNGYNENYFGPEDNVTYEQAIKMLVMALGYEPMATQKGDYPTGHLAVANTIELTKNISIPNQKQEANRELISMLVYNALDIPIMEQTSFGTNNEFTIQNGENGNSYITILSRMGVAKIEGVLTATAQNGSLKNNEISYKFHKDRVYGDANWKTFINQHFEDEEINYATADLTLADYIVDAADYLQTSSTIYLKEMFKGKYEVIAIMPGELGSTVKIDSKNIESIESEENYNVIFYYPSHSSVKTNKYKIATSADYYFNYSSTSISFEDFVELVGQEDNFEITLVENNGNTIYDAVMIKQYHYDIIKSLEINRGKIEGKENDLTIELNDSDVNVIMTNAQGEEITLDDFSEGDVIAYISEEDKRKDYSWIEIINLGNNVVSGVVDEVDNQNDTVYINSSEYEIINVELPSLGDEGLFYLTETGKIFYIDTTSSASDNYAYVLDAAFNNSDFTEAWQIKLLTKDNKTVIYTVRDIVEVDGEMVNSKVDECDFFITLEAKEDEDGVDLDKGAHRVITFKLDSKNKIKEINTVDFTNFTDKEYNEDAQVLSVDIADGAAIFNVSADKSSNYYATDISALVDEAEYSGSYITNANYDNDCIVIAEGGSLIDYSQDIAVIASVTDIKLDEGATDAKKIRYYTSENDTLNTLIIVEENDVTELVGGTSYEDIAEGALIMFADNAEGTASAVTVIASLNENYEYVINETAITDICDADDDNEFIMGTIDTISTVNSGKKIVTIDGETIVVKSSTNAYTYQNRNGKTIIHVGDWRANNVDKGMGYVYIARIYNGSVKDIITNSILQ